MSDPSVMTATDHGHSMDENARKLQELKRRGAKVKSLIDMYDPDMFSPAVLKRKEDSWMSNVTAAWTEFMEVFFTIEDEANGDVKKLYDEVKQKLGNFTMTLNMKILSLGDGNGEVNTVTASTDSSQAFQKRKQAQINADVELEKVSIDVESLTEEVGRIDDWSAATNMDVEVAMQNVKPWNKRFRAIQENLLNAKKIIRGNNLETSTLSECEEEVSRLEALLEMAVNDIVNQDEVRGLFSLSTAEVAKVKYPTFSGQHSEDFLKFLKEIKEAFISNKVRSADKVKTLRDECLKGDALSYVPKNLVHVEDAFKNLSDVYGDEERMGSYKKEQLSKLGAFPHYGSLKLPHLQKQVKWLTQLHLLLGEINDLSKVSKDMFTEFYNPTVYRDIKNHFPLKMKEEIIDLNFTGNVEQKMESLRKYLERIRAETLVLVKDSTDTIGNTASLCQYEGDYYDEDPVYREMWYSNEE